MVLLPDDTTAPSSGHFKARGVGLSPDVGAIDIYITAGSVTDSVPTISGVSYTTVTDYTEGTPGSYRIIFTAAGSKDVLFQSDPQTLSEGQAFSAAVFPSWVALCASIGSPQMSPMAKMCATFVRSCLSTGM